MLSIKGLLKPSTFIIFVLEYGLAEWTTGISVGSQPGEQVPTTRSSMFDENSHFSPTMSMSIISTNSYTGPYASPLLNKRRITRRVSTLRRSTTNVNATTTDSPASTPVGATTVHVRKSSAGSQSSETKPVAQRSKSQPADFTDSADDESSFERRASLKQKLFGGRGRNKTPEGSKSSDKGSRSSEKSSRSSEKSSKSSEKGSSDALTQSSDSISSSKSGKQGQNDHTKSKRGKSGKDNSNSKEGKGSKKKTLMGRFSSTRPLSAVEVVDNSPKQIVHQRTRSDASLVKKHLDAGPTSPQAGIVLENSPSHSSCHTVVSLDYVP